jgi:hypothetical protein
VSEGYLVPRFHRYVACLILAAAISGCGEGQETRGRVLELLLSEEVKDYREGNRLVFEGAILPSEDLAVLRDAVLSGATTKARKDRYLQIIWGSAAKSGATESLKCLLDCADPKSVVELTAAKMVLEWACKGETVIEDGVWMDAVNRVGLSDQTRLALKLAGAANQNARLLELLEIESAEEIKAAFKKARASQSIVVLDLGAILRSNQEGR